MLLDLPYKFRILILFAISFVATMLVFEPILKIAKSKDIVDVPNARKLQKVPIPVMGGIAVFFGIIVGLCYYKTLIVYTSLFPILGAMVIMLYIGAIDDCIGIKPVIRLIVEIVVCLLVCYGTKMCINTFQGFLGVGTLSHYIGIPLSVLTFLGIVNSINMIDGVDGLASGMCIFILGCFGLVFFLAHDYSYAVLAAVSIGALLPFILHNVFGFTTKMFLGDSGTMMIATIIAVMTIRVLNHNFDIERFCPMSFSRVGFVLALLSIPIADTLRVILVRVKNHKSPLSADKNHFHHILIQSNFSYIGISIIEIGMAMLITVCFFLSWILGASVTTQVVVVIVMAALSNWITAMMLVRAMRRQGHAFEIITKIGDWTHVERTGLWANIQHLIDRRN